MIYEIMGLKKVLLYIKKKKKYFDKKKKKKKYLRSINMAVGICCSKNHF